MGIFNRKAKQDPLVTDDPRKSAAEASEVNDLESGQSQGSEAQPAGEAPSNAESDPSSPQVHEHEASGRLPRPHAADRSQGPYDRSEIADLGNHLDFGSMAVLALNDMELRIDVDDTGVQITGLTSVIGESGCQLQAFAAPKTSGIWDSIRDEIADNLIGAGGSAEEKLGPLGIELHARMPSRGADGRTVFAPARFIGVDGPRWFLRAVLSGTAAHDDAAAEPLLTFVRNVVISRGAEARAPRELLPLELPAELSNPVEDESVESPASTDDFAPFERGPEITEVR